MSNATQLIPIPTTHCLKNITMPFQVLMFTLEIIGVKEKYRNDYHKKKLRLTWYAMRQPK